MSTNPRLIDMTGQRFEKILITGKAGNSKRGAALWFCKCDCGKETVNAGADIRAGKVKSCGCLTRQRIGQLNKSHGKSNTRLHNTWKNIKARCYYKKGINYKNYGGRGITLCKEWHDFETFYKWAVNNGYKDHLTIERVDVNKGYNPDNCTWIAHSEQSYNRNYTIKNQDGILWSHVAVQNGIPVTTFHCRKSSGWSMEEASTHPLGKVRERYKHKRDENGRFIS